MNLPDDKWIDIFLDGNFINKKEAVCIEQDLLANHKTEILLKLLGYYETRHVGNKTVEQKRANILIYLINRYPSHLFWRGGLGIIWKSHSEETYKRVKEAWLQQIEVKPHEIEIILNAAAYLRFSEIDVSEDLINKAIKLDKTYPAIQEVRRLIDKTKQIKLSFSDPQ